jgi:hypothetical protein
VEKVVESGRLKVNGESVDASRNAEISLAGLGPHNHRSWRCLISALSANLVQVVEEEHEKLLGARWQRDQ